jgi:hypothetical protein
VSLIPFPYVYFDLIFDQKQKGNDKKKGNLFFFSYWEKREIILMTIIFTKMSKIEIKIKKMMEKIRERERD